MFSSLMIATTCDYGASAVTDVAKLICRTGYLILAASFLYTFRNLCCIDRQW